jgi:hypothetical protein
MALHYTQRLKEEWLLSPNSHTALDRVTSKTSASNLRKAGTINFYNLPALNHKMPKIFAITMIVAHNPKRDTSYLSNIMNLIIR